MFRKHYVAVLLCLTACNVAASLDNDNDVNHVGSTPQADGGKIQSHDAGLDANDPNINNTDEPDANVSSGFVYQPRDINHVLITGQSNSVALFATPVTTTQPYGNLSFNTGVMPMSGCDGAGCKAYQTPNSFIPLVEGDDFFTGSSVETASSGFANEVSKLRNDHTSLISLHGRSGNTYWCLSKRVCNYKPGYLSPFEQGMQEVRSAKALASASGKSYIVRAVLAIHGESDHYSYTANTQEFPRGDIADYADAMLEWQSDYEGDVKAITGQTDRVPLFMAQVSGWNDTKESRVAQMQLDAHNRSNGMVILVTPGYHLGFQSDCRHYTSLAQRKLGEYFAKAYYKVVIEGKRWEPVRPRNITRNGNTLILKYYVPAPPLVLDTDRVANPGNYGFEFTDSINTTITNVVVSSADTITITLSNVPGSNARLTYAQNQVPNTCLGVAGARGNIRDSDKTPSQYGYELFNWGVHFMTTVL